jgi:type VI secretion system protein ImpB
MSNGSSQDFIGRNRPPRVHIGYKVETGNATELKEIPFIMGVMADLSGDRPDDLSEEEMANRDLGELGDRKFREVDAHSFDKFMKAKKPQLSFEVDNTLTGEGKLKVNMTFESMDDFSPAAIAKKVEGLKELYETREKLQELLTAAGKKPKLEKQLQETLGRLPLQDAEAGKKLLADLGDGEKK